MAVKFKKTRLRRIKKKARKEAPLRQPLNSVFLPNCLDQVRAIAMHGLSDDEIARNFGVSPDLLQDWIAYYPSLRKAIEEGRSRPDQEVVLSLYKIATGNYEEEALTRHGTIRTLNKHKPDISAIKTWLHNLKSRKDQNWGDSLSLNGGRNRDGSPTPLLPQESRNSIIDSIVALVACKPDPPPEESKKR